LNHGLQRRAFSSKTHTTLLDQAKNGQQWPSQHQNTQCTFQMKEDNKWCWRKGYKQLSKWIKWCFVNI